MYSQQIDLLQSCFDNEREKAKRFNDMTYADRERLF